MERMVSSRNSPWLNEGVMTLIFGQVSAFRPLSDPEHFPPAHGQPRLPSGGGGISRTMDDRISVTSSSTGNSLPLIPHRRAHTGVFTSSAPLSRREIPHVFAVVSLSQSPLLWKCFLGQESGIRHVRSQLRRLEITPAFKTDTRGATGPIPRSCNLWRKRA